MNINALPAKLGAQSLFSESFTLVQLINGAIMFFSMLAAAAVNILGIEVISEVFAKVMEFGGGLLVGGVILIIGNFLSTIVHDKLSAGRIGSVSIAAAAAFGLGGRDAAKTVADTWARKISGQ